MKNAIIIVLGVLIITLGVTLYLGLPENENGILGGQYVGATTIVGSAEDAVKIPTGYVEANTTSTDPAFGGGLIQQRINTDGVAIVRLNILAKAETATGTITIKPEVSYDNENFFPLMYSTSSPNLAGNGTTTPSIFGYVTTFLPGTSSTTWSYDFNVNGSKATRFIISGGFDADGDLKEAQEDYVQAWITAVTLEEF